MQRKKRICAFIFLIISTILLLSACGQNSTVSPVISPTESNNSTPTATIIPAATFTPEPTSIIWPFIDTVDIVSYQSNRNGSWFSEGVSVLPKVELKPEVVFNISDSVISNRKNGNISPTLISGYYFIEWPISRGDIEPHIHTIGALFLRSATVFVDYPNQRGLWWDHTSKELSSDFYDIVALCNENNVPVYLEINYTDYVPGEIGTGIESFIPADNIKNTIDFIKILDKRGLYLTGLTFGNEIGDEGVYGKIMPTMFNSDLAERFILFSRAIKSEFPELKIYGFDSYIAATRGQVYLYYDLLQKIRRSELKENTILLDGFTFRESNVYINEKGELLDSQFILDDTESLYRNTPVYRYDVWGNINPKQDRAYLPSIIDKTYEIFERHIDIGNTEYLPAGPVNISEIDTSRYSDMDFIIHYSDIVGIYAELGLDIISKIMFGNSIDMHKAYFDRDGNLGVNYPVHEQLAEYFLGQIIKVDRTIDYEQLKVKVYATRKDGNYFILILNKDVKSEHIIEVNLPNRLNITMRIPQRSYTSLIIDNNRILISGIGN